MEPYFSCSVCVSYVCHTKQRLFLCTALTGWCSQWRSSVCDDDDDVTTSVWSSFIWNTCLTFRHRASCILGQAFRYSPENAFYIFNQQIKACVIMHPRCCRPVAGRQHRGCIIPQAVTHSLVLLKLGKIIARNMLSWMELLISRYCCI